MSRPGFLEGALAALLLSLTGAAALAALVPLLGPPAAWRMVAAGLGAAYVVYLLCRSAEKTGRVVIPLSWLAATAAGWALPGLGAFLLLQITLIWLIRSLYYHSGVLAALADLVLTTLALLFGLWALRSGSWLLALWSFFLVQALFTWIRSPLAPAPSDPSSDDDGFDEAHAHAVAALERLATR